MALQPRRQPSSFYQMCLESLYMIPQSL
jgi:hypothetical protein